MAVYDTFVGPPTAQVQGSVDFWLISKPFLVNSEIIFATSRPTFIDIGTIF